MILTPVPEYALCARIMNDYHLALSLRVLKTVWSGIKYPKDYSNTPSVAMWKDCPTQLLAYGMFLCNEATMRRLPDPRDHSWIASEAAYAGIKWDPPFWLGNKEWHSTHRGIMHVKDPAFYTSVYIKTKLGINFSDRYIKHPDAIFSDPHTPCKISNELNRVTFNRLKG